MSVRVRAVGGESHFGEVVIDKKGLVLGEGPPPGGHESWEAFESMLRKSGVVGSRIVFEEEQQQEETTRESEKQPARGAKGSRRSQTVAPIPVPPLQPATVEEVEADAAHQEAMREKNKEDEEAARKAKREEKQKAKEEHLAKKGRTPKEGGK